VAKPLKVRHRNDLTLLRSEACQRALDCPVPLQSGTVCLGIERACCLLDDPWRCLSLPSHGVLPSTINRSTACQCQKPGGGSATAAIKTRGLLIDLHVDFDGDLFGDRLVAEYP
jgi:hypothetical protein